MAFSLPFFSRKSAKNVSKASPNKTKPAVGSPQSNSSSQICSDGAIDDFVASAADSGGGNGKRLIWVESEDADARPQSTTIRRSSQLSKTLEEVLHDKDALAYFIHYLEVQGVVNLIRFWLDAEAFRLSASERIGGKSVDDDDIRRDEVASGGRSSTSKQHGGLSDGQVSSPVKGENLTFDRDSKPIANDCTVASVAARHSDAHGGGCHAAAASGGVGNVSPKPRTNFTDTGASDPRRGLHDRALDVDSGAAVVVETPSRPVAVSTSEHIGGVDGSLSVAPSSSGTLQRTESDLSKEQHEQLIRSIEHDAVAIFAKYLSPDCPNAVFITEDLRLGAVHKICRESDHMVDLDCFSDCQRAVFNLMNSEYYPGFRQSVYHCKHQIDVLTGSYVCLADVLYDDTIFSYFTEFMEAEHSTEVLQCFLDLDNFQHLLSTSGPDDGGSCAAQMQADAVVIYDKYFSLQATHSLRFEDQVRKHVENNLSREDGVEADCFQWPRHIVYCYIQRIHLPMFLKSELYYKYLSDLINTVHYSQDGFFVPRKRQGSDANSEPSVSSVGTDSIASRNTLLAVDTRGSHIKTAINKITDNMRIDGSLLDPDNLWQRPNVGQKMTFGRVNEFGQFISDFDPGPEQDKKGLSSLFPKKSNKAKLDEEMALQVAQMIINDVTMATKGYVDNS